MTDKKKVNYVDNKKFLQAMVEYRKSVLEAAENGGTRPVVPMYVASCIMKIATHLSYKPNFINYSFREEMISDGIENCLQYIDNFNPEKFDNPFAYFTQIIYYAFLRRIDKEKKYLYTKYKVSDHMSVMGMTSDKQGHDESGNFNDSIQHSEWSEEFMSDFIESFEQNKRRKRVKKLNTTEPTL
jgi:hypothetical protein